MLFVISGAVAAGKTTVSQAVADRLDDLILLEEDKLPASTGEERLINLTYWIDQTLSLESEGKDTVLGTQAPLGEVLASPPAIELEGIAGCLLDVFDSVRVDRWIQRGVHPDWPIGMDHFCWAAFHRLHARDPQFEQRVLLDRDEEDSVWNRWTGWTADDPRWDIHILDTTNVALEATIQSVTDWIERVRVEGAPLMKEKEWWK